MAYLYYALRKRRKERETRQALRAERAREEQRPDGDAPGSA